MRDALQGRTALITGAATGIGRATAERFAREGAQAILFGLGGAQLDEAAHSIGALAIHGDVASDEDLALAITACEGRLDVIVNAAGVLYPDDPLSALDAAWERTFNVNLTATMKVCRAGLPLMIAAGKGAIVNVASVAAFNSAPYAVSYAASKAAVVSITRSIAYAHGTDGVRANCVAPGWVRTPMSEMEMRVLAEANSTTVEHEFRALADKVALRRVAKPEEIAACCLFLASDEASFVTGAVLIADGGGRASPSRRPVDDANGDR